MTQFLCLVEEKGEVSFGIGLVRVLLSRWLAIRKCCPCFCPCFSHAFNLGLPCIDFYTLMSVCLLSLEQPKQGILRNESSMTLIPFALPEVKGEAGSNSSPGFVVLFKKINNGKKLLPRGGVPRFSPGTTCISILISPNLKRPLLLPARHCLSIVSRLFYIWKPLFITLRIQYWEYFSGLG